MSAPIFEYNTCSFLIDIIDCMLLTSVSHSHDQLFHQWQFSIWSRGFVCTKWSEFPPMAMPYLVTLLHRLYYINDNLDTDLYQFLQTGTSDRTIIGRDQRLKCIGFRLYPLSFYSPFKEWFESVIQIWTSAAWR